MAQSPSTPPTGDSSSSRSRPLPSIREDIRRSDTPFERVLRNALERRAKESSFYNRVIRPTLENWADKSLGIMKGADMDAIRYRLMRAGFPRGLRARDFFFIKVVGMA